MNQRSTNELGKVYLVGAGPGDPGLITLKGIECLRRADVVLYDYLVNARIVEHVAEGAKRICLGQHGRTRIWTQDEINDRMVQESRAGKTVVRLKGGDPAVFARGAEETEYLVQHGIPLEIVPGITAALAASSYAGIPITHRDLSSAVALVTGQEKQGKQPSNLDYAALAKFPGTLVMYMGVTTARQWTDSLIRAGMSPQTPSAIIRRCSFPDQKTILCTLREVADQLTPYSRLPPPVIVIIGPVAHLGATHSWFDKRPLFGTTVMVTRPIGLADSICQPLEALGAHVIRQPAIKITEPDDWTAVDSKLDRLDEFDWLVFSSVNGVRFFLDRLPAIGMDLRALAGLRIATIGPGTAHELSRYRLRSDLQPGEFRAEALAEALTPHAAGRRILLVRASRGREVLAEELSKAGGEIQQVVAYQSLDVADPEPEIRQRMSQGEIDWVTVTSSAIARSLVGMFGVELKRTRLASISPVTSDTLRQLDLEPAVEAERFTMEGVVDAILMKASR